MTARIASRRLCENRFGRLAAPNLIPARAGHTWL